MSKAITNCGGRHGLEPEALDRLLRFGKSNDVSKNQFPFAACVARIDQPVDILTLDQFDQHPEPSLAFFDRLKIEMWRYHRQIVEGPFAASSLDARRNHKLKQMSHRRGKHILLALVVFFL